MYLARIDDSDENDFVGSIASAYTWIGANDRSSEGQWRWSNNDEQFWQGTSVGNPVGGLYNNWNGGEPNDSGGEDCAEFYLADGFWNDVNCADTKVYLCEGD